VTKKCKLPIVLPKIKYITIGNTTKVSLKVAKKTVESHTRYILEHSIR
jgi:hypothetical protein